MLNEPRTGITRRTVLLGLTTLGLSLAVLPSLVRPALADATSTAQSLVVQLSAELTKLVNSGQSASGTTASFQKIVARYADVGQIATSILGPAGRSASAAQKQAFASAFLGYFARKYGKTFSQYKDASIDVTGAENAGKAGILVHSLVNRPGQESIRVDWQISDRSGTAKVVNLIIEGVSMLANERAEVGAMLDSQGGNVDAVTAQMNTAS